MSASEFGHAIGVPGPGEQQPVYQPSYPPASYPGASYADASPADELDLSTVHAQARQKAEAGDLTGARTMIEEALAAGELRVGRDHPALVPLMVDLATLARRLGNLTEARNQLRRAYTIIVASSGPEHATSLSLEGRLAAVLYRLGEQTESYDWHLSDAGRRVLGADHPAVRGAEQRLAAGAQAPVQAPPLVAPPIVTPPTAAPPVVTPPPAAPTPTTYGAATTYGAPGTYGTAAPAAHEPGLYGPALTGEIYQAGDATVRTRRRRNIGGVALVASLLVLVLVGAVVVALQLLWPGGPAVPDPVGQGPITVTGNPTPTAPPTSPAPTGVTITDGGGTVTLTWRDPSGGKVPFVVSGGRQGQAPLALATVPAGETTTTIYGLNVNYNYCFTVAAVWSAEMVQESARTCTTRTLTSASPSL